MRPGPETSFQVIGLFPGPKCIKEFYPVQRKRGAPDHWLKSVENSILISSQASHQITCVSGPAWWPEPEAERKKRRKRQIMYNYRGQSEGKPRQQRFYVHFFSLLIWNENKVNVIKYSKSIYVYNISNVLFMIGNNYW